MAATISTSTRFRKISLGYNGLINGIGSIRWGTDEDNPVTGRINTPSGEGVFPTSGDEFDNLTILQEIYASENGFQDADGGEIIPIAGGIPGEIAVADLESHGIPNPLIEGFADREETSQNIEGAFLQRGSHNEDTDTGLQTIGFAGQLEVNSSSPRGSTFTAALSTWRLGLAETIWFRFRLFIPTTEEITEDELDDYTPMRTLLAWLEDNRTAGTVVGTDASDPAGSMGNGRRFSFAQASGDSDIVIGYAYHWFGRTGDEEHVTSLTIEFDRISGAAVDAKKLEAFLRTETISLSNTDAVKEDGYVGGPETILECKELDFGAVKVLPSYDGIYVETVDHNDIPMVLRVLTPNSVDVDELPQITSDDATSRLMPLTWNFDTIRRESTSAANRIRLRDPGQAITFQKSHRRLALINNTSGEFFIDDWGGDEIIRLLERERLELEISLEGEGKGGFMRAIHAPDRVWDYGFSIEDYDSDYQMRINSLHRLGFDISSSEKLILLPFYHDNIARQSADAFTVSDTAVAGGSYGDLNGTTTDFDINGVIRMRKPGSLEIIRRCRFDLDDTASGVIGNGHGVKMYRLPATGVEANPYEDAILIWEDINPSFSGQRTHTFFENTVTVDVEEDDRIISGFSYNTGNTTLTSFADLFNTNDSWIMKLTEHIEKAWAVT